MSVVEGFDEQFAVEARDPAFFADEHELVDLGAGALDEVEALGDVVEIGGVFKQKRAVPLGRVRAASQQLRPLRKRQGGNA